MFIYIIYKSCTKDRDLNCSWENIHSTTLPLTPSKIFCWTHRDPVQLLTSTWHEWQPAVEGSLRWPLWLWGRCGELKKQIVVSAECCEQCEFRIESKWCKAHICTVESEIRPSFRNSELLKGASKWYPGKLRYETSACLATLEPVVKKRKTANVQHRILACPRSTLHLHYRHLMP